MLECEGPSARTRTRGGRIECRPRWHRPVIRQQSENGWLSMEPRSGEDREPHRTRKLMFVLAPAVGMKQQRHSAVGLVVVLVAHVLGFDMEPEQLGQATRHEPGKERYGCKTTHAWTHRAAFCAIMAGSSNRPGTRRVALDARIDDFLMRTAARGGNLNAILRGLSGRGGHFLRPPHRWRGYHLPGSLRSMTLHVSPPTFA